MVDAARIGRGVAGQDGHTSNEMCSLPNRISSSCRPSLFFCGHFESSSLHSVS